MMKDVGKTSHVYSGLCSCWLALISSRHIVVVVMDWIECHILESGFADSLKPRAASPYFLPCIHSSKASSSADVSNLCEMKNQCLL